MGRDFLYSIGADYLQMAQEGDSNANETLEAIADNPGNIELYLPDKTDEQSENARSIISAAKKYGLNVKALHMSSELAHMGEYTGKFEALARMRNTQLDSNKEGGRDKIQYQNTVHNVPGVGRFPESIVFHPGRVEREDGKVDEDYIQQAVYNMTFVNNAVDDDIIDGFATIENIGSRTSPHFSFKSVEDAKQWKEVLDGLPEAERSQFGFTLDTTHTDYPIEMLKVLGNYVEHVHHHGRIQIDDTSGEISGDEGIFYDNHLPPQDGEEDPTEIVEALEEQGNDADITFEIKPEELDPDTVEETNQVFGI